MLTAFYSTKKEWSLNLLFPSGNTSEDYLRILRNVPTKGAAAYMRGEWSPAEGRQSWLRSALFMSFKLGLVANSFLIKWAPYRKEKNP